MDITNIVAFSFSCSIIAESMWPEVLKDTGLAGIVADAIVDRAKKNGMDTGLAHGEKGRDPNYLLLPKKISNHIMGLLSIGGGFIAGAL